MESQPQEEMKNEKKDPMVTAIVAIALCVTLAAIGISMVTMSEKAPPGVPDPNAATQQPILVADGPGYKVWNLPWRDELHLTFPTKTNHVYQLVALQGTNEARLLGMFTNASHSNGRFILPASMILAYPNILTNLALHEYENRTNNL